MAELKKELGLLRVTFYGVGTIVGAGIYTVIGTAAGQAEYDFWLSFIFAAVAASFSALSYAELSSTYPNAVPMGNCWLTLTSNLMLIARQIKKPPYQYIVPAPEASRAFPKEVA